MATATSRTIAAAALAAVTLASTACGGGARGPSHQGEFAWLRPGPAPSGWPVAHIPVGAAVSYPPGWKRIKSDPGTASAASFDAGHRFLGYLNLTPRQGAETTAGWARFRVEHNADEHEHGVTMLAAATGLRFRTGRGACVRDAYTTTGGIRYIELACLLSGRQSSVVAVGASPAQAWPRISPLLERAISTVTA